MAHSNRKSLRDARGGKTRNQQRKAQSAPKYGNNASERIRELENWQLKKLEAQTGLMTNKKVRKPSMTARAKNRRLSALTRLMPSYTQPKGKEELTKSEQRINAEIITLKQRCNFA